MNEIRRFIILIDILYEKKNNLVIRSGKNLFNMFEIKKLKYHLDEHSQEFLK